MPVACEYPDLDDWTQIQDAELRKRVQNRLSQRRHREKIRKQNGTTSSATRNRKTRSETAVRQTPSSSASRSASPQALSNTSTQGGSSANDHHGSGLDAWDDTSGDDIVLDADWNDLTFLDGQNLSDDALFPFPSNSQVSQPSLTALPTRPLQLSLGEISRPCSCGAHARGWASDQHAPRLSPYPAFSNISQLSPASMPAMPFSNPPSLGFPSPGQDEMSPRCSSDAPPAPSAQNASSVSEKAQRPKIQRTSTADSAIELSVSDTGEEDDTTIVTSGSRKRSRAEAAIGDGKADASNVDSKAASSGASSLIVSPSPQDENSILTRVSAILAELTGDEEAPTSKRQKMENERAASTETEDCLDGKDKSGVGDNQELPTLPKIRRGTLPSGEQIIVIVMKP